MEKSILWYQPAELSEKDVVTSKGQVLTDSNDIRNKFRLLKETAEHVIGEKKPWCGMVNNLFFLKGYLNDVDKIGRQLSFMYLTDAKSDQEIPELLQSELNAIGYDMDEQTKACLDNRNKSTTSLIVLLVISAIIIAIIVAVIFND